MTYSGNDLNEPWEGSMFASFEYDIEWNTDEDWEDDSDETTALDVPDTHDGSEGTNL